MNRTVSINGKAVDSSANADVLEHGPGFYSVLIDGRPFDVRISGDEISVNGHQMMWHAEDPREWKGAGKSAGAKGRASMTAPMPGKIVRILVKQGDRVEAGQGIFFIEAMKMQNELKSPKAGYVASLNVAPEESVTAGTVLAVID